MGLLQTITDKNIKTLSFVFILGIASGLPLALVFSTLSVWLKEFGVDKTTIGLFSMVSTPYVLKFLWAPLIDGIKIPYLHHFGRRKSWLVVTQIFLMISMVLLGFSDPVGNLYLTALAALLLSFLSATQDIIIDAYRIEILDKKSQALGAAILVYGYRIGMLISGGGALIMAEHYAWHIVYSSMAIVILVTMFFVLFSSEKQQRKEKLQKTNYLNWFRDHVIAPFQNFMQRENWFFILFFITLYKFGDAFAGVMTNPFLLEIGFSKQEIGVIVKFYGFIATMLGLFLGGVMATKFNIIKSLLIAGILQMVTNFIFCIQAMIGHDATMLAITIGCENLAGGIGTTVFVAYISRLCNLQFTATQYALLSSLAAFARSWFSASSGWFADNMDWVSFFIFSAFLALPALIILVKSKNLHPEENV